MLFIISKETPRTQSSSSKLSSRIPNRLSNSNKLSNPNRRSKLNNNRLNSNKLNNNKLSSINK